MVPDLLLLVAHYSILFQSNLLRKWKELSETCSGGGGVGNGGSKNKVPLSRYHVSAWVVSKIRKVIGLCGGSASTNLPS